MKLLIDQNISHKICPLIGEKFFNVHHIKSLGLVNKTDYELFQHARTFDFDAIITLDEDFFILQLLNGVPPKIIWLRTGNCTTFLLSQVILENFKLIETFINDAGSDILEIYK